MAVWRRANLNWTSWWFSTAPRRSAGCVRCCRRPVRWALSTRWPQRWMPKMLAVDAVEENKWLEHVRTNDWLLNFHPQWTMIFKGKHMMLRLSRLNHFSFGLAFVLVQAKGHTNGSGLNCGFESRSHYGGTESNWNKIMVGFSNNQELHTHTHHIGSSATRTGGSPWHDIGCATLGSTPLDQAGHWISWESTGCKNGFGWMELPSGIIWLFNIAMAWKITIFNR